MATQAELVCVGAAAGAFGVRGEVRIKSFTERADAIFDYAPFLDETGAVRLTVVSWRAIKDGFAAYCGEVATREEAMTLRAVKLFAPKARLPRLADDEFYHADLIGLRVTDLAGAPLGVVRAIHNFGADDLLEVWNTPDVKGSWYLPFTRDAAPKVDLARGEIVADPPDGFDPRAPAEPDADAPGEG